MDMPRLPPGTLGDGAVDCVTRRERRRAGICVAPGLGNIKLRFCTMRNEEEEEEYDGLEPVPHSYPLVQLLSAEKRRGSAVPQYPPPVAEHQGGELYRPEMVSTSNSPIG